MLSTCLDVSSLWGECGGGGAELDLYAGAGTCLGGLCLVQAYAGGVSVGREQQHGSAGGKDL